jgi:hypothetical protein
MTDWLPGCCHPTGGPHGRGEPQTCCHVHAEDLASNREGQRGEPVQPPTGWTAGEQARIDELTAQIAKAEEEDEGPTYLRHRHHL